LGYVKEEEEEEAFVQLGHSSEGWPKSKARSLVRCKAWRGSLVGRSRETAEAQEQMTERFESEEVADLLDLAEQISHARGQVEDLLQVAALVLLAREVKHLRHYLENPS